MASKLINVKSRQLTDEENEIIFNGLGNRCQALATTTAELHVATSDERNKWEKQTSGVVCFVKDWNKRSFFIRFYDEKEKSLVWEDDMKQTRGLQITTNDSILAITAAGNKIVFLDDHEGDNFEKVLMEKLNARRNRRNRIRTSAGTGTYNESENTPSLKKSSDKSKRKITLEDIGKPTNVRHNQHIGWNPDTGLHFNDLDPDMRSLFEKIGITDHDRVDNETMKFIYDFVENHGGTEAFAKENREQQMKKQVPTPPNRAGPPPPPPPSCFKRAGPPPQPPPSNINRAGPPPPPPPSNINRAGPPSPPSKAVPPSPPNRAGPPPPPNPSKTVLPPPPNRAGPPPPPPPSNINRAGPPPPPPPPSNINRAGPPSPPSKAVPPSPPNRAGPPPPPNPSKTVHPPPPNRTGPPPPQSPSKVVPPPNSNKDKFGLPPPPSRNTSELPPPHPSRAGPRLASPSHTDTDAAHSLQDTDQGATGESNPIKQQIMQLLLQNPAEITDFLYDIIDKRGGVDFIKDSLAQQMNKTHTTKENDQEPPDYSMQNVSDNVSDVQAASELSNRSEVPGRKKTSDNVSGRKNAREVSGATRNLLPDYELSSDMFDDDDDEWGDLNDKVDQE